ncbi:hypothetical protein GGQ91_002247 [Methylobacterium fujisawaense]|jgi:hypothetical protein|uniref:Transposase n=1 Tax=Methylobacterium fujisawaense TaxID=107400 RepID=A0ABR6DBZ2_9HYPH|nr:hypothetical protein [Methylobacterium fujisawaense]SFU42648.1 hypothetical protein SAMN02799643_00634 [Methylobacterium sp. UNCCL125]
MPQNAKTPAWRADVFGFRGANEPSVRVQRLVLTFALRAA